MKTLGAKDSDIDFSMLDGLQSAVQRVTQRLRFWRGEWYIDAAEGVPYIADVLGHDVNIELAKQAITAQIRTVPDIIDVSDATIDVDVATRTLHYSARLTTRFGTAEITVNPRIPETDLAPAVSPPPHHIPVTPDHPDHPDHPAQAPGDYWDTGDGARWTADNLGGIEYWNAGATATSGESNGEWWSTPSGDKWTGDDDDGSNYWGE